MELAGLEQLFVNEYIGNGGNAALAYRTVKPGISEQSARSLACRILKRPHVIEAIRAQMNRRSEEQETGNEDLRQKRINEFLEIKSKAMQKEKLGTAVNALDRVCNIEGHYRHDDPKSDAELYTHFIKKVTVEEVTYQDNRQVNILVNNVDQSVSKCQQELTGPKED